MPCSTPEGHQGRPDRIKLIQIKLTPYVCLQIVQSLGFEAVDQEFPIYADRMPTQLLAYLRLSRLQDSGDIIKASWWQSCDLQEVLVYRFGCIGCAVALQVRSA